MPRLENNVEKFEARNRCKQKFVGGTLLVYIVYPIPLVFLSISL